MWKSLLIIISIFLATTSCHEKSADIEYKGKEALQNALANNSTFREYMTVQREVEKNLLENRHQLGRVDWLTVNAKRYKAKTMRDLTDLYGQCGMREPEVYVKNMLKEMVLNVKIKQLFPNISNLSPAEQVDLFERAYNKPKDGINPAKLATKRQNNSNSN